MHIRFLGTGAADFSPLLETEFKNKLDHNIRRSSSILINDTVLVDCGPHTLDSLQLQGVDLSGITDLLVTHLHADHYDPDNIAKLAKQCKKPLRMWYHEAASPDPAENAELHPVKPFLVINTDAFRLVGLPANHREFPLHYDIEIDGIKLFYGCDGAWLLNDTFYAMMRRNYECMILDGTVGDYNGDIRMGEHNSIPMIRLMTESFRTQDVIAANGILCISHLARTLHKSHGETASALAKEGYLVAYDGMALDLH